MPSTHTKTVFNNLRLSIQSNYNLLVDLLNNSEQFKISADGADTLLQIEDDQKTALADILKDLRQDIAFLIAMHFDNDTNISNQTKMSDITFCDFDDKDG